MLKVVALAGLAILAAAGGVLLYAATLPDNFTVSRSVRIAVPADTIFPQINDLRTFNTWNPFAAGEGMKLEYSGPVAGAGAINAFSGTGGTGKLAIVSSEPSSKVVMQLDMEKPLAGHNRIVFALVSSGNATDVSWTMSGKLHLVARAIGVFVSMDTMVGGQFEKGLKDLKTRAEKPHRRPQP